MKSKQIIGARVYKTGQDFVINSLYQLSAIPVICIRAVAAV